MDLIANSTNYNALAILMKGYKEYTFAIRQSGTDVPTITVTKDDFALDTPLTFTYLSTGIYRCDTTSLGMTTTVGRNSLHISNACAGNGKTNVNYYSEPNTLQTYSVNFQGNVSNDIFSAADGVTISIRETLT